MTETFDIAIIGAGMAGSSLAAECAHHARVLLIEAEDTPGYHTTGRSAAFWHETIGGPQIYPLTAASGDWLAEHGFLSPRGGLHIGRKDHRAVAESFVAEFQAAGARIELIGRERLERIVPGLRPEWIIGAWEPECADIDVAAMHQHYLAAARKVGSVLRVRARLDGVEREGGAWSLAWSGAAGPGEARAALLVNAAGAWADGVAQLAGAAPLGVQPLRRSMVQLRVDPVPPDDLPLTLSFDEDFYFRPQGGRLWLSPHDETPDVARDAAPEELDIAMAIDRMEQAVDWKVLALERRWAGLRSFASDRLPIYGFDARCEGLFWFAGQGGFGIQTAPAAARLGAQLLLGLPRDAMTEALDAACYSPARFGSHL
ncbi:FAD-dependent oxidoreductase [Novosphingobium sp. PASSN1]|uniref:NAD(P)/FAD-dependent oxidoreductase n=1 Tax=Novosphingobium sp. PASSN1 TaxID=2015561 RepID=UPI000BDC87E5|nr:FAD-dependent oxidoreductase [Novosphingobium sp. PASSN1]OYU36201.1 MAG: FAD-dependent oxidoreductase [Novosphingobium sp. PASSN1]